MAMACACVAPTSPVRAILAVTVAGLGVLLATAVVGNVLATPPAPGVAPLDGLRSAGISLQGTQEQQATNLRRDNTVGHFETNIGGCVQSGNTTY
ncbi:MAG: hypothetical protein ACREO3_06305 [Arenimonas sp.]